MLYRQKYNTFIRAYDTFGYIINKSNFTDQVTDKVGSIFLKSLSRDAKDLHEITKEIMANFADAEVAEVERDIQSFFGDLEEDGFIVSGKTPSELNDKDQHFSYSMFQPNAEKKCFSPSLRTNVSTQKYLDNYLKNKPQLMSFQIELTSRCNERCIHCYIPHESKSTDIDPDLYYSVLEQCKKMGVMDITLSGGEPMLHPKFLEFLHKAKANDFSVTVLSNLTLLNDEIIAELKSTSLSGIQVSLYSMDADTHDSITQRPGSFLRTKKAILKLIENDIPVQISCPTMKQNKSSYAAVAKWATSYGLRVYTDCILMARYNHTTDNLEHRMTLSEMETVINEIIEYDKSYQNLIKKTDFSEIETRDSGEDILCSVGITSLCMTSDGKVFPCAGWQSCVCGSLKENSLNKIWIHSSQLQYLRSLRKKDLKRCLNCSDKEFCSFCMARNANEDPNGNPLKIYPDFCKIAEMNKSIVLKWKNKLSNA